jgi:hypothetical protein
MGTSTSRRFAPWLLSVPLMVAGTQVAHAFDYRIVYPNAHVRLHALVETGHGYFGYAPFLAGIGGALELVAFVWILSCAVRARRPTHVPPWAFALLPPLAFVIQEIAERWVAAGSFPWWAVLQPTFGAGLLLQLPFAFLAYLLARLLMRAARRVAPVLRGASGRPAPARPALVWLPVAPLQAAGRVLAGGHLARGPPLVASS